MKAENIHVKEEFPNNNPLQFPSTQPQLCSKRDPRFVVRARTYLTESSLSSGRVQPSDSPLCAHYSNEKKKTSRKRKAELAPTVLEYNLHYVPRILKNDLRRQYPVMFTNVFNSFDFNYVRMFLETFCRPDMVNVLESFEPHVHMRKEEHGYDSCGKEFMERMTDSPDSVFSLKEVQMRVKSDGTCALHSKFELSGTKIIHIDPRRIMNIIVHLLSGNRGNNVKGSAEQEQEQNKVLKLPFTPEPPSHFMESDPSSDDLPKYTISSSSSFSVKAVPVCEPLSLTDDPPDEYLFNDLDLLEAFEDCYVQSDDVSLQSFLSGSSISAKEKKIQTIRKSDTIIIEREEIKVHLKVKEERKEEGKEDYFSPRRNRDITESDYEYLYNKFEDAMNLHRDCDAPRKPEETLPLAIPYRFVGDFIQHIDLESKVFLTHFAVRVSR